MSQALGGAVVVSALLVATWLLGRRRPALMRSTDAAAVAALNRAQMALVAEGGTGAARPEAGDAPAAAPITPPVAAPDPSLALDRPLDRPGDARGRAALLRRLQADFAAAGPARQRALAQCLAWGDRAALPLVRRGLRDADPVVAGLAARAMEAFRGRSQAPAAGAQPPRLPRNVSRTL